MSFWNEWIKIPQSLEREHPDTEGDINTIPEQRKIVQLLKGIGVIGFKHQSLTEGLEEALRLVCTYGNWQIGHIFYVKILKDEDGNTYPELDNTPFWYFSHPTRYGTLRKVTDTLGETSKFSFPGKVLATKQALWIEDIREEKENNIHRSPTLVSLGLYSACAFPVTVGGRVIAVLEFFSKNLQTPSEDNFGIMEHIGELLGNLIESRWAEEAMRASEKKFRSVFETAIDGIVIADESNRISAVNPAFEAMFGYNSSELIGQPLTIIMPERFREGHLRGIQRVANGGATRLVGTVVEIFGLRKDGTEFAIELSLGMWKKGDNMMFCGIMRPSASSEAEKRDAETARFKDILDAIPAAVSIKDLHGNYEYANDSFTKILGVPKEEIIGKKDFELRPQEEAAAIVLSDQEALFKIKVLETIETVLEEDGKHIYRVLKFPIVPENKIPEAVCSISTDITEQIELEHEKNYFYENSPDIKVILDYEGKFLDVNPAGLRILGYSKAELLGISVLEIVHQDDIAAIHEMAPVLLSGKPVANHRNRYRRKDGTYLPINWNTSSNSRKKIFYGVGKVEAQND